MENDDEISDPEVLAEVEYAREHGEPIPASHTTDAMKPILPETGCFNCSSSLIFVRIRSGKSINDFSLHSDVYVNRFYMRSIYFVTQELLRYK